jgi:hypothetical protein
MRQAVPLQYSAYCLNINNSAGWIHCLKFYTGKQSRPLLGRTCGYLCVLLATVSGTQTTQNQHQRRWNVLRQNIKCLYSLYEIMFPPRWTRNEIKILKTTVNWHRFGKQHAGIISILHLAVKWEFCAQFPYLVCSVQNVPAFVVA